MSDENVEKVYRQCQKRERDRERKWRIAKRTHDIRNTFRLVDFEKAEAAEESPAWLSDGGKGVEDIVAACDGEDAVDHYRRMLESAREKVRRADPSLLEVFALVVRNGTNRKESIWELVKTSARRTDGMPPENATGEA